MSNSFPTGFYSCSITIICVVVTRFYDVDKSSSEDLNVCVHVSGPRGGEIIEENSDEVLERDFPLCLTKKCYDFYLQFLWKIFSFLWSLDESKKRKIFAYAIFGTRVFFLILNVVVVEMKYEFVKSK